MLDRIPPDLVDSLGIHMEVKALLVGSVLAYGYRDSEVGTLPEVAISLRLVATPGSRILWSAVHSRDGSDRESVFGLGRNQNLTNLASQAVHELLETFPETVAIPAEGEVP